MKRRSIPSPAAVEGLERRTLLSATITGTPVIVNTTKLQGSQAQDSLAVNPANPNQFVVVSNNNLQSIFLAQSSDAGHSWTGRIMLNGTDGFPQAEGQPSVAFDHFGNLFLAYRSLADNSIRLLNSFDAGQTFHMVGNFSGSGDRPTVATGDDTVWVAFTQQPQTGAPAKIGSGGTVAYGAQVYGLGRVKSFKPELISSAQNTVQSLVVGPAGQITAAYTSAAPTGTDPITGLPLNQAGPTQIFTSTDADGTHSGQFKVTGSQIITQVGPSDPIPPQQFRGIDPGASLAYDTSGDAFTGRLYMTYTDAPTPTSPNTNIYLRYSDDSGATWSGAVKVNDDQTTNSHFNPRVAVDPVTGTVGLTWYDARNDNGIFGPGGTDTVSNDDVQLYGAVGTPAAAGVTFSPNIVIQPAFSNPNKVVTATGGFPQFAASANQFGFHNDLVFYNNHLYPAWADNSNSTADNGDGLLAQPDIYVADATVQTTASATAGTLIGSFGDSSGKFTYAPAAGMKVSFHLSHGLGYVFLNGSTLSVRVANSSAASALAISAHGGAGRASLGSVAINGSIGSITAPTVDVSGVFFVQGDARRVTLGNITGGTFATAGAIGRMKLSSLTNGLVVSGANPGPDLVFSGPSDPDDSFGSGSIDTLTVTGAIQGSTIAAGVNPVDGIFGNGNDKPFGAGSSRISKLVAASADSASRFEASVFSTILLPAAVNPASDPRFVTA